MKNGDLPAMPIELSGFGQFAPEAHTGFSKRERFAMAAMQGLCSDIVNIYENLCGVGEVPADYLARQAVFAADALLAELERTK